VNRPALPFLLDVPLDDPLAAAKLLHGDGHLGLTEGGHDLDLDRCRFILLAQEGQSLRYVLGHSGVHQQIDERFVLLVEAFVGHVTSPFLLFINTYQLLFD